MFGDQTFDNRSTKMRTPRGRRGIIVDDKNSPDSNIKGLRPGMGGSQTRNSATRNSAKEDNTADTGLERKTASGVRDRKADLNHDEEGKNLEMDQKKLQPNSPSIQEQESPDGQKTNRRKRGRPPKVFISSLNAAASDKNENGEKEEIIVEDSVMCEVDILVSSDTMLVKDIDLNTPAKDSLSPYSDCKKLTDYKSNQKNVSADASDSAQMLGSNIDGSNSQHERQIPKKSCRRSSSAKDNSQTRDTTKMKMVESVCITKEAKMGSKQGRSMSDDQPLSKWVEEMQSAGASAVPKLHTESMKVKELIKNTPDCDNNEGAAIASDGVDTPTPAVGTESVSALCEPELPFVKNTSLWAVVESMEVFLKMPQKPHFRPLLKRKESSREGFAIATMVNFCSAVERISRLQFDDPKEKIDDILDSLNDLETHGFRVQVLRDRISELLSIKEKREKLGAELEDIHRQLTLCNIEKSEQEKEIKESLAELKKLEEKIMEAESIKEFKDGEIAALESRCEAAEETMRRSRSCYEELAAALLRS